MRFNARRALVAAVLAGLVLSGTTATGAQASSSPRVAGTSAVTPTESSWRPKLAPGEHHACSTAKKGQFHCLARWQPVAGGSGTLSTAAVKLKGLTPEDIRKAYKLPTKGGKGQVVGIVVAYDNPKIEADLNVYRKKFKLGTCTTASKCFRKVDQRGGKKYPVGDQGWGMEAALDTQAVSATCRSCRILLVEADSPTGEDIGAAVNTAVRLGADVVSNSYGMVEFNGIETLNKKYYTHPKVPLIASSGDAGFQDPEFPASSPRVWSIGATDLNYSAKKKAYTEKAASFSGSNCSAWFAKPSWQKDKNCAGRTSADISAAGDGAGGAGFLVYDSYLPKSSRGWIGASGTSVSAPLVAGMIGLAGNAAKVASPSYPYKHKTGLKDVIGGSNAFSADCGGDYLCTAVKGYDGPTGLGSPRGLKSL